MLWSRHVSLPRRMLTCCWQVSTRFMLWMFRPSWRTDTASVINIPTPGYMSLYVQWGVLQIVANSFCQWHGSIGFLYDKVWFKNIFGQEPLESSKAFSDWYVNPFTSIRLLTVEIGRNPGFSPLYGRKFRIPLLNIRILFIMYFFGIP